MNRLFEFADQPWLPRLFRDLLTELLHYQLDTYRTYWPIIPKLNEALRRSQSTEILDLCSGSGGPLLYLRPYVRAVRFTLSDKYPNRRALQALHDTPDVTYLPYPLDARAAPRLTACRTLFTSFHHFNPSDARRILQSAVEAQAPIAVFEFTERTFANIRGMLLAPLAVWRDTWQMRPRRLSRLFWTYVAPVIPFLYTWDGIVSHWRTYRVAELRALTEEFTDYAWEVGTLPPEAAYDRITYLIGIPAA